MPFCTECGTRLADGEKYCSQCGTKVDIPEIKPTPPAPKEQPSNKSPPAPLPSIDRHELGNKLEEVVEAIFKADGYTTQRRQRIHGVVKGYTNEIDIIAIRGNDRIAVECKNHTSQVGIAQVRDFAEKILDLGPGWRGVFVGYSDFSEDASEFAQCRNIEQLTHDEVMERWFAVSVGRSPKLGEKLRIEDVLPVNYDYPQVSALDFVNKEKIQITDAKLVFHPYIRYTYSFRKKWRDPTKEVHNFSDQGTIVVDLLNNELVNPPVVKDLGGMTQALTRTFSSKASAENFQRKKIFREVSENNPLREITRIRGNEYQIQQLAVDYSKREINHTVIDYITGKNSHVITYVPEKTNSFSPIRSVDFTPDRGDIKLSNGEIIFVPKWSLHFLAFGSVYTREILACSGTILEDTIALCPHHFNLGILTGKTKNIGVCEKCGSAFCKSHGRQCAACNSWLCDSHSVYCNSCKRAFCQEHIPATCSISEKPVCNDCVLLCPVCGKPYGKDLAVKCNTCGQTVCPLCATTSGIIKRVTTCKRCQPK
jgi:hypothetical protein